MKRISLFCLILFAFSFISAQELKFPNSIVSAGGSNTFKNNKNISRWRIGYINIAQLNTNNNKSSNLLSTDHKDEFLLINWNITAFPNPVNDYLQVQFDISVPTQFKIIVTDITGRKVIEEEQLVLPNRIIKLDFKKLISALYIVNIKSKNETIHKILKVSKR